MADFLEESEFEASFKIALNINASYFAMLMKNSQPSTDDAVAQEIVRQLSRRAATSSICPFEVARALHVDETAWRALMPQVREVAAAMRHEGRLRITRGGGDVPDADLHRAAIRLARGPGFLRDENPPVKRTP